MRRVWYWCYIVWLSFRWMFQTNIGNRVRYRGMVCTVCNGVVSGMWRLQGPGDNNLGWVPRAECQLVLSPGNLLASFRSGYRFYMGYWYSIWVQYGIETWVRGCQIWPRAWAASTNRPSRATSQQA